ncbi:MAG: hypothetical protein FWB80_06805 [Defluviitaleaceae bacterium]|nr:hypothetical protein [Defluviitaleaceae bacterium]
MKKLIVLMAMLITACGSEINNNREAHEQPPSTGRIFLYGENHGSIPTMDRQLEIWGDFYNNYGMRHLFLENSYFGAQFLNMWMAADDDTILYELFEDWRGSPAHNPHTLVFYRTIKRDFPETIFHGTDVGHQSDSTGQRFLQHLTENNLQDTELYRLAQENIAQYRRFRREGNHAIRAYYKPQNFIREFDALKDQDVMAIHGMAHVAFGDFGGQRGVPTMATVLRDRYGDALQTFDMTSYAEMHEPYRIDTITVNGVDFQASYFGNDGIRFRNMMGRNITGREFWRLENAYEHFSDIPAVQNVLPHDQFPMNVEVGQVFVIDIHFDDGVVEREFYRASGFIWNDIPATQQFYP